MLRINADERGLSLVELLIALGLVAIVFLLAGYFYVNISRSTNIISSQTELQQEVNLAKHAITEKIKYATSLILSTVATEGLEPTKDDYNTIYGKDGKIYFYDCTKGEHELLYGQSDRFNINLEFTMIDESYPVLGITVIGEIPNQPHSYDIHWALFLKNEYVEGEFDVIFFKE